MKKKTMKNGTRKILTLLLLLVVLTAGCGKTQGDTARQEKKQTQSSSSNQELTTIRAGVMTGITEHYIAAIGKEKGIYEKYGIDLQVTEFSTGVEAVGAVTLGQLDIAECLDYGVVNRIGQTSKDTNLKILAENYETNVEQESASSANQFYVNPDKIKELKDIKGRNISVALGTVNEYQDAKVYELAGLTGKDVNQVALDSISMTPAATESGQIDAVWAAGAAAVKIQKLGWKSILKASDVGLLTRNFEVSSREFAEKDHDALVNYFKARDEIVNYIEGNVEEAAKLVKDKISVEEDIFKGQIAGNKNQSVFTQDIVSEETTLKDWAYKNGNFDTDFSYTDFIDVSALKEAFPDRVDIAE